MKPCSVLLVSLLLGACATASDCGGDWYAIGQRDGRIGAQMQAATYASRCSAQVDEARYAEGWRDGYSARPIPLW
jgi:predicted small secreted protein